MRTDDIDLEGRTVAQKEARFRQLSLDRGAWQPISQSHFCNLAAIVEHYTISLHDEGLRALLRHYRKRLFKSVQPAGFDRDKGQSQYPGGLGHRRQPASIDRNVRIEQNAKTRE